MSKKVSMKQAHKSRRDFLKTLGVISAAALIPALVPEDATAIPIYETDSLTKKKAVAKKKVATKKKTTAKKKVAKKKVVSGYYPRYDGYHPDKPPVSVPEPGMVGLVAAGIAGVALASKAKKKNRKDEDEK